MKKVFLGGTWNGSRWRNELIEGLESDYFNPVVSNWTKECQKEELKQKKECDFVLYCITPEMTGVYSIAEAVDDSNKIPEKTLFCVLDEYEALTFTLSQRKSLDAVVDMIKRNGGKTFESISSVRKYLNEKGVE